MLQHALLGEAIQDQRLDIAFLAAEHENFRIRELVDHFLPHAHRATTPGPNPDPAKRPAPPATPTSAAPEPESFHRGARPGRARP